MDNTVDPSLSEKGIKRAQKYFLKLSILYGIPDEILSSPYERCRQTASIASEITGVKYKVSRELSNFIPRIKRGTFTTLTRSYNPYLNENNTEFHRRVHNFSRTPITNNQWIITHGYFVSIIAESYDINMNFEECEGIMIKDDEVKIFN